MGDGISHKCGKVGGNIVIILSKARIVMVHNAELAIHFVRAIVELVNVLIMALNLLLYFRARNPFVPYFCQSEGNSAPFFFFLLLCAIAGGKDLATALDKRSGALKKLGLDV